MERKIETLDNIWEEYFGNLTPEDAIAEYGGIDNLLNEVERLGDEEFYWPEMRATYKASELIQLYLQPYLD